MSDTIYKFDIDLNVLNHLGRNLYRNFITVLGEAISNSWDADANNVWIDIDMKNNNFTVKDDGIGMDEYDFQVKFLTIGYSKRTEGDVLSLRSPGGRPYIGAKGIGKLALLSCADTVSIISKTSDTDYVHGVIDNSDLTKVIEKSKEDYQLGDVDWRLFERHTEGHNSGTIIHFENIKKGIRNTLPHLRKLIALYFRFSLIDDDFNIHLNGKKITSDDLEELSKTTEFLWKIGDFHDPFIDNCRLAERELLNVDSDLIEGFIATVAVPRNLKITGTDEKVGVDLFVNGRLRERDLLKHIATARITESYMYGQIHFDALDADGTDRFTSSREGVIESDEKYQSLLKELKDRIVPRILSEWDALRLDRGKDGDDESPAKTPIQRRALSMLNMTGKELELGTNDTPGKWIRGLASDAEFNIPAYVRCFLSENLLRKYIADKQIDYAAVKYSNRKSIGDEIQFLRQAEANNKIAGGISICIRENDDDLSYLDMDCLALVIGNRGNPDSIANKGKEYKPMRDAVMHTALLTEDAKQQLKTVYNNIKAKIRDLLNQSP